MPFAYYAKLSPAQLPLTEDLEDTVTRFLPCWHEQIAPALRAGQRVIVAAHGNSLRALVKYLDNISEQEILGMNIPTGIPLVYELDKDLKPIKHSFFCAASSIVRMFNVQPVNSEAKRTF